MENKDLGTEGPAPEHRAVESFRLLVPVLLCAGFCCSVRLPLEKESLHDYSLQSPRQRHGVSRKDPAVFLPSPLPVHGSSQPQETETWGRTTAAGGGGEKAVAPVADGPGASSAATGGVPEEMSGAAEEEAAGGSWEGWWEVLCSLQLPVSGTEIFLSPCGCSFDSPQLFLS